MTNIVNALILILQAVSEILTAGIAITAFALLLYSLSFNLKDIVARAFAVIMVCLVIIFSAEAFSSSSNTAEFIDLWLRGQWIGIILLAPAYLHFSDALLATTGQPSRWRRKWAVRLTFLISCFLIVLVFSPWFLGNLVLGERPAPHHKPTILTELFTIYYLLIMVLAYFNFYRAYRRTLTRTSKRRMLYLIVSAAGPALGSFPFLLYGSEFAARQTVFFWVLAVTVNLALSALIFIMAYAVAFFGVPWPDRVVKSRLVKWTLRGPITASLALTFTTLVNRGGEALGIPYSAFNLIVMVITILLMEYGITIFYPFFERRLFFDKDEHDLLLMRSLEERIITRGDLKQFIEMVLSAVTDRLRADGAYLLAISDEEGLSLVESTGSASLSNEKIDQIEERIQSESAIEVLQIIDNEVLLPLTSEENGNKNIRGYLGLIGVSDLPMDISEENDALRRLISRAALALRDRDMLEQVFSTLEKMNPQEELIQELRAVGRFDRRGILEAEDNLRQKQMNHLVKDALTHYWGGPKLTESPLMEMLIVKEALRDHDDNPVNALRSVLKTAIEQVRPEGERKFTNEWILYNILDLKFMEGKKVREISLKLAVSEADLYRKQKIAIDMIAEILVQMELKTTNIK